MDDLKTESAPAAENPPVPVELETPEAEAPVETAEPPVEGDAPEVPAPPMACTDAPASCEQDSAPCPEDNAPCCAEAEDSTSCCVEAEDSDPCEDDDKPHPLADDIAEIAVQVAELGKLFKDKIARTEHEKNIVDRMHSELQKHKEDMYTRLTTPILKDIIAMRNDMLGVAAAHHKKPEGEQSVSLKSFEIFIDVVKEILEKNDIEIYKSKYGAEFVPVRQRALKVMPVSSEAMDKKIAQSISDGYSFNEKVIIPEMVAVYKYDPEHVEPEETKPEPNEQAAHTEPKQTEHEPNEQAAHTELEQAEPEPAEPPQVEQIPQQIIIEIENQEEQKNV